MCKTLHVLPRGGGVLDQPSDEILRLEQIFEAYARYDEYEKAKSDARARNAKKHAT